MRAGDQGGAIDRGQQEEQQVDGEGLRQELQWIELLTERRNVLLVFGFDDTSPRLVKLNSVPRKFPLDSRRDDDLRVQITQEVELIDGGEIEDWRAVGNDDQEPGSLFARCRSCSMASKP